MPARRTNQPSDSVNTDNSSKPSWNSSALEKHEWFADLELYILGLDPSYDTLIKYGYVIEREKIITVSIEHSIQLFLNNIEEGSFRDPTPAGNFKILDPTVSLAAFLVPASAPAASSSSSASTPSSAPSPAPPPSPSLTMSGLSAPPSAAPGAYALPAHVKDRYKDNPDIIKAKRRQLCSDILDTVISRPRANT